MREGRKEEEAGILHARVNREQGSSTSNREGTASTRTTGQRVLGPSGSEGNELGDDISAKVHLGDHERTVACFVAAVDIKAVLDEAIDDGRVVFHAGDQQGVPASCVGIEIGHRGHDDVEDVGAATLTNDHESVPALTVLGTKVCTLQHELLHNVSVASVASKHSGRPTSRAAGVHIGSALEKKVDDLLMAVFASDHEGRLPPEPVRGSVFSAKGEKETDDLSVSFLAGVDNGGVALLIKGKRARPVEKERQDGVGVVVGGGSHEGREGAV